MDVALVFTRVTCLKGSQSRYLNFQMLDVLFICVCCSSAMTGSVFYFINAVIEAHGFALQPKRTVASNSVKSIVSGFGSRALLSCFKAEYAYTATEVCDEDAFKHDLHRTALHVRERSVKFQRFHTQEPEVYKFTAPLNRVRLSPSLSSDPNMPMSPRLVRQDSSDDGITVTRVKPLSMQRM